MKSFTKMLHDWFGYTRRERRSSLFILGIIILVISARYVLPRQDIPVEDISSSLVPVAERKADPVPAAKPAYYQKRTYHVSSLELNKCDSADLEKLPGIGPVLSARIVKYRNLLGGYATVSQLREVYGLSDSVFCIIEGRLTADTSFIERIRINSAGVFQLNRHPYLDRYESDAIVKYRTISGEISGITELIEEKILTREKALKILPYIRFD